MNFEALEPKEKDCMGSNLVSEVRDHYAQFLMKGLIYDPRYFLKCYYSKRLPHNKLIWQHCVANKYDWLVRAHENAQRLFAPI